MVNKTEEKKLRITGEKKEKELITHLITWYKELNVLTASKNESNSQFTAFLCKVLTLYTQEFYENEQNTMNRGIIETVKEALIFSDFEHMRTKRELESLVGLAKAIKKKRDEDEN